MATNDFRSRLSDEDCFLTRREAAEYLRRSIPTLERWAAQGLGPAWKKAGGRVLYALPELRRFASGESPSGRPDQGTPACPKANAAPGEGAARRPQKASRKAHG